MHSFMELTYRIFGTSAKVTSWVCLGICTALCLGHANSAFAQASTDASGRERAHIFYERSKELYREGKYTESAALLRQAYELEPEPVLLFNLGRTLEAAEDYRGALEAYAKYLSKTGHPPDEPEIRARMAELKKKLREQKEKPEPVVTPVQKPEEQTKPTEPQETQPEAQSVSAAPIEENETSSAKTPWPWIVAGAGAAIVVGGIVVGVMAQGKNSDAEDEPVNETAMQLQDDAEGLASISTAMLVVGGVIAVGGASWGVIELLEKPESSDTSSATAQLRLLPAGVALQGTF